MNRIRLCGRSLISHCFQERQVDTTPAGGGETCPCREKRVLQGNRTMAQFSCSLFFQGTGLLKKVTKSPSFAHA